MALAVYCQLENVRYAGSRSNRNTSEIAYLRDGAGGIYIFSQTTISQDKYFPVDFFRLNHQSRASKNKWASFVHGLNSSVRLFVKTALILLFRIHISQIVYLLLHCIVGLFSHLLLRLSIVCSPFKHLTELWQITVFSECANHCNFDITMHKKQQCDTTF